jgi:hypothetical protein
MKSSLNAIFDIALATASTIVQRVSAPHRNYTYIWSSKQKHSGPRQCWQVTRSRVWCQVGHGLKMHMLTQTKTSLVTSCIINSQGHVYLRIAAGCGKRCKRWLWKSKPQDIVSIPRGQRRNIWWRLSCGHASRTTFVALSDIGFTWNVTGHVGGTQCQHATRALVLMITCA